MSKLEVRKLCEIETDSPFWIISMFLSISRSSIARVGHYESKWNDTSIIGRTDSIPMRFRRYPTPHYSMVQRQPTARIGWKRQPPSVSREQNIVGHQICEVRRRGRIQMRGNK